MTYDKWIVLIGGVAAIVWLNWNYFRGVNRRAEERKRAEAAQRAAAGEPPTNGSAD